MDSQSETGNAANDILWEVKDRALGKKAVGRTSSQSLFWGQCTPSVIGEDFAVVLSWAAIRIRCPKFQVSLYWFRSAVKLFNSMLNNTNSDILRRVVQADLNLQPRSSACWTAQLLSAFQGLRGCEL